MKRDMIYSIAISTTIILFVIIISISIFLSYMSTNDSDFEKIKGEFQSGDLESYRNASNIPREYYLKPEFYPSYNVYKDIEEQKGTYGYGAYPDSVFYTVNKFDANRYIDIYTFVHSSYDVGNYQGMELNLISPNDTLFETGINPTDILLHPIILGDPEKQSSWSYRIQMIITSKIDIPKGEYIFSLTAGSPSLEKQKEFQNITQSMNGKYINIGPIRPTDFFDFVLNVS